MEDEALDVLALAAHPDDIELSCAATLIKLARKGYRTGVVALTAGEMGTRGAPDIRRQEFERANGLLGVVAGEILDLPDGKLRPNEAAIEKLIRVLRRYRPALVLAPHWETRHPDHGHCSVLAREAAFLSGLKRIDTQQAPHRPARVLYYMELYDFTPSFIVDVSDTFDDKVRAIQAYESQFYTGEPSSADEGATYIGTPEFLNSILVRGQYWGNKIGAKYGEPFVVREPLKIDDPVRHFSSYRFAGLM